MNYTWRIGKALLGEYLAIGEVEDEDGYEWRGFCFSCEEELENETEYDLYHDYEPCPLNEELH